WSGEVTRRPSGIFEDLARQAGVNMTQYASCVDTRKYAPQIQANVDEGQRRGVPSTPTFLIGNKMVSSAIPYDEFKRYVDVALALASVQDRWAESRRIWLALVALTAWGVVFTGWLTYLELFVIHAICRWCVGSAVLALSLFALSAWELAVTRASADARR